MRTSSLLSKSCGGIFELPQKKQKILELEDQMATPGFWDDREKAQEVSKTLSDTKSQVDFWDVLEQDLTDMDEMAVLLGAEPDEEMEKELEKKLTESKKKYESARITTFFSEKYDDHDGIVSIHSGAGGLDAQDWAEMLFRMYTRYCENRGFKTNILDQNRDTEGGVKSATFEVFGRFAYGYLKSEAGVHRLIRLSPFNTAHTRETSFALVEVLPILKTHEEIKLNPKDLKIETSTSSGHGGQSVNTTYSAVRITHIPTGVKVSIQNERSQHQNKEKALSVLRSRLKQLEDKRQQEERKELRGEFHSAEWGNQIRTYTLHPYKLVKDHRTGFETADVDRILDGGLDEFVEKYLENNS